MARSVKYSEDSTTNADFEVHPVENNTIYLCYSENSFPHKIYLSMKEEFGRVHLRPVVSPHREDTTDPYAYSDNESNNVMPNTNSANNKVPVIPKGEVIPMSMDIATQFNSDMKIIIKQDSKDSSIINIKFGGPIQGNVEGTGNMSRRNLMAMLNERVTEQVTHEVTNAFVSTEKAEKMKIISSMSVHDNKEEPFRPRMTSSNGNEESINYFASTLPTESVVKSQKQKSVGEASQRSTVSPETIVTRGAASDDVPTTVTAKSNQATFAEYSSPYSMQTTGPSLMQSESIRSPRRPTVPAILPKCIVRRISRAMMNDLSLRKKSPQKTFELEKKMKSLNLEPAIANQNWHAAIKRGKVMIGEIIELVITVNIDQTKKTIEEIGVILADLRSELINSCVHLLTLVDRNDVNQVLALELIIDIINEELDKVQELAVQWVTQGHRPSDFSTVFIEAFTEELSVNNSDTTVNITESKMKTSLKSSQNTSIRDSSNASKLNSESVSKTSEKGKVARTEEAVFPDPSIITNSRAIKTMRTIMEVAVEEKLSGLAISPVERMKALQIAIVNKELLLERVADASLLKQLVEVEARWIRPISTGQASIRDLIEFIITTTSQDRVPSRQLFDDIIVELNQLEKELIVSLVHNLYSSRQAGQDLKSLCYEIMAEILFEEMSIASYMFKTLDDDTAAAGTSVPLGKLYRTYVSSQQKPPSDKTIINFKNMDTYAHQTTEVKNYAEIGSTNSEPKDKDIQMPSASSQVSQSKLQQTSVSERTEVVTETTITGAAIKTTMASIKDLQTQAKEARIKGQDNSETLSTYAPTSVIKKNKESESLTENRLGEDNRTLLIIIDKLNSQTKEINKIKENLQQLSGKVDDRFSQWKCKFSLDKVNEYCDHNSGKSSQMHFADATKVHNSQEVVQAEEISVSSLQPSLYHSKADLHDRATIKDSKSFVAPISDRTSEQPVSHKKATVSETMGTADILNLIVEGSLTFLKNKSREPRRDTMAPDDPCREINIAFDNIFKWICDKYHQKVKGSGQGVVVERDVIKEIVAENNLIIDSWVKEICYKRFLDCLTT